MDTAPQGPGRPAAWRMPAASAGTLEGDAIGNVTDVQPADALTAGGIDRPLTLSKLKHRAARQVRGGFGACGCH